MEIKEFATKAELFRYLKENKDYLIAQKKFEMKRADAVSFQACVVHDKEEVTTEKSVETPETLLTKDVIKVRSIINTTNLLDGHGDCHINGLWKKSLKEQKNMLLLREHKITFDYIISDNVEASTKKMTWKELGFDFEGETEALIFDSEIAKSRNPYMFEMYARGYVKSHSVGMSYVKMFLCINSEEKYYMAEKADWDKYIGDVANRAEAEEKGYFWAVTEAKLIEGSAVPMGSNWATPTQSVKEYIEPSEDTRIDTEPPEGTQKVLFINFLNKIQ